MNINLTKKQIESLTLSRGSSFVTEQLQRFEIFKDSIEKIDEFTENEWEHINTLPVKDKNFPIDLIDLDIKKIEFFEKNYPDENCELLWYDDKLYLFLAYNYYKKNGYDCLPLWDREEWCESGSVLLLKNK
jgi:hypothetical protein